MVPVRRAAEDRGTVSLTSRRDSSTFVFSSPFVYGRVSHRQGRKLDSLGTRWALKHTQCSARGTPLALCDSQARVNIWPRAVLARKFWVRADWRRAVALRPLGTLRIKLWGGARRASSGIPDRRAGGPSRCGARRGRDRRSWLRLSAGTPPEFPGKSQACLNAQPGAPKAAFGVRGDGTSYLTTRKRTLVTWPDRVASVGSRRISWGAAGQLKKRTASPSGMGTRWMRNSSIRAADFADSPDYLRDFRGTGLVVAQPILAVLLSGGKGRAPVGHWRSVLWRFDRN